MHFATSLSDGPDSTNTHYDCSELLCRQLSADQLSPRILQLWRLDYCLQGLNKLWTPKISTAYRGKRQVRSPRRADSVVQPIRGSLALDDQAKLSTGPGLLFLVSQKLDLPLLPNPPQINGATLIPCTSHWSGWSPPLLITDELSFLSPDVNCRWDCQDRPQNATRTRFLPRRTSLSGLSVNACSRGRHDYGMILLRWLFLAWVLFPSRAFDARNCTHCCTIAMEYHRHSTCT